MNNDWKMPCGTRKIGGSNWWHPNLKGMLLYDRGIMLLLLLLQLLLLLLLLLLQLLLLLLVLLDDRMLLLLPLLPCHRDLII